ncbi:MAG TPA: OmpA family protein, partial [Kofleriaceae bacterium]|nr:OmpA family protein [Kofleriaceae bacterium]
VPLELGASLPFSIVDGSVDGQGIGDFGFHAKARVARVGRVGVGAIASLYVPTGSDRNMFVGEAATTPQLMAVADANLGRLRLAVNGGVRLRRTTTMGSVTSATTVPVGIAAAYALSPEKVELVAEVFGSLPTGDGYRSAEALGGLKVYLAKNSYMSLGAGRGLLPGEAGNPDFRAVIGIVFEPKPAQRVSHSIADDVVAEMTPPKKAGDLDADSDNDLIRDRDDRCPDDMEDYDGEEDEDGCPEASRERIVDVGSELVTLQPIEFEFDKDVLRDSAFPILDEVVKAFIDNSDIELVEVQGHTDEQGNDAYNLDLSKRRAATVMRYLDDHGIAASRLTSNGYGETKPVDKRHTQDAYKANRRVQFVIQKRGGNLMP